MCSGGGAGLVDPVTILDFPQRGPCHSPGVLHMADIGVAPGYARAAKVGRVRAHGQVDIRGNNAVDELASLGTELPRQPPGEKTASDIVYHELCMLTPLTCLGCSATCFTRNHCIAAPILQLQSMA